MATIAETLFPSVKQESLGSLTQSAASTPEVSDVKIAALTTPPPFNADVSSTIDASVGASSISEPDTIPEIPEQKVFQMNDGRFYNPATGVSATTREEAMGLVPPTSGPSQLKGPVEAPAPSGGVPKDDITSTIRSLYPDSDSLVKTYDDLRKSSGIDDLETQLNQTNQEMADLDAIIAGIEDEVRAQAGGQADASFIAATVADRMRRLAPRVRQVQARQQGLESAIASKKDAIAERIGLTKADIEQTTKRQADARRQIFEILEIYGSGGFAGSSPEQIAELERIAGLPPGAISGRTKTIKEREAEAKAAEEPSISEKYGTGVIGEYNFYSEQERAAGHTPLSFNEYQNLDANRKAKATRAAVTSAGGTLSADDEIDILATAYNRGESLGAIGASRKAVVIKRAAGLKAEEAAQAAITPEALAALFEEADLAGQGIGAATRDARGAGVPEENIREALRLRLENEKETADSFWLRLFAR